MQIPQIRLNSTMAKIEITTTQAQQTIEQPKAIVNLKQSNAEMEMRTTPGQLTIDQTIAWESMDIKHIFRRIEEGAQKGYQDVLSGMARVASEGDEMMRIEHGGSPIASQAERNSKLLDYSYNIGFVPPPFSVKLNYQPGQVSIHIQPKKVENHTVSQKPLIHYSPGQANVSLRQHADLNIDFVNIEV